jgi:hypothetical protein
MGTAAATPAPLAVRNRGVIVSHWDWRHGLRFGLPVRAVQPRRECHNDPAPTAGDRRSGYRRTSVSSLGFSPAIQNRYRRSDVGLAYRRLGCAPLCRRCAAIVVRRRFESDGSFTGRISVPIRAVVSRWPPAFLVPLPRLHWEAANAAENRGIRRRRGANADSFLAPVHGMDRRPGNMLRWRGLDEAPSSGG